MSIFDLPDREVLTALVEQTRRTIPAAAVGFVRSEDGGTAHLLFLSDYGLASYGLPRDLLPEALRPDATGVTQAGPEALARHPDRAAEWQLSFVGAGRVVAMEAPGTAPLARFWVGTSATEEPTTGQLAALAEVAARGAEALRHEPPLAEQLERYRRLDRAASLVPALLRVLDVRDVFERLSEVARLAVPHDLLVLRDFSDDLTTASVYAVSRSGPVAGPAVSHGYPPSIIRAWEYSIVDDLRVHPIEAEAPLAALGARSVMRVAIKFDDRTIGGLAFLSNISRAFSSTDLVVGRRLADHVAVALSHHRLAEERREAAALRERTVNLEMLDGLLGTLAGVLDIREVFHRVSTIAQTVLPHDGLAILEMVDGGARARVHASHGLGSMPDVIHVPLPVPPLLDDVVETRIVDDYHDRPEYAGGPGAAAGMRSALFVSIHLEGKVFGGLNFYSRTPARFTKADVLVARRVADHVALALSHRRLAEQVRATEELRAQALSLEMLDGLLAAIIDSGELTDVFERVCAIARRVLPHDAALLMVRLADGMHARVHASAGLPVPLPPTTSVPPELLEDPEWDHHRVGDLTHAFGGRYSTLVQHGMHSLLRVPIRLEGRFAGALVFLAKAPDWFPPDTVAVARRMADRLAISLAHDREVAAERRADEATERAARLEARVRALTDELDARTGYRRVIGESPQWRQVLTQATQVAATDTTALLLGESGTGKEVVARFIHRGSPRKGGPFVALNCAALPEQLLEAELFGYERGAFTGAVQSKPGQLEQAAGGTIFLDEVGEMSPAAQAKFLRVLQEREFQRLGGTRIIRCDARIVAATNRDLPRAIAQGRFREDLYYRLNVFAIHLPPLRHRRADILALSEAFLSEIGKGLSRSPGGISRDARDRLVEYHWPGNVRELRNILERASILCEGGLITADLLGLPAVPHAPAPPMGAAVGVAAPTALPPPAATAPPPASGPPAMTPPASADALATLEKTMIENALAAARFNKSKAARALGMTRHQLYIRMRKHGLE